MAKSKTIKQLYGEDLVEQVCNLPILNYTGRGLAIFVPNGDSRGYCVVGALNYLAAKKAVVPPYVSRMPSPDIAVLQAGRVLEKKLTRRDKQLIKEAILVNDTHLHSEEEYRRAICEVVLA